MPVIVAVSPGLWTVASPATVKAVTLSGSPSGSPSATSPAPEPVRTLPLTGVSSPVVAASSLATGTGLVTVQVKVWSTEAPSPSVAVMVTP